MIRRAMTFDQQEGWLLISQIAHAKLAGQLAEVWGNPPFKPIEDTSFLAAIIQHDDGWSDWDAELRLHKHDRKSNDQKSERGEAGIPIAFNEMAWPDTEPIWAASIDALKTHGSLAQFVTARHFLNMLEASNEVRENGSFVDVYSKRARAWLAEWCDSDRNRSETKANEFLSALRFFDYLSLWLCCAPRSEPVALPCFEVNDLKLQPKIDDARTQTVSCDPWPWTVQELNLSAEGRWIPRQFAIESAPQIWRAGLRETISWVLIPA